MRDKCMGIFENILDVVTILLFVGFCLLFAFGPIIVIIYFIKKIVSLSSPEPKIPEIDLVVAILKNDPGFDVSRFKFKVLDCFTLVNEYYASCDLESLMPLVSTELFNIYQNKIEVGLANNSLPITHYDDIKDVVITSYTIDGDKEVLGCTINATARELNIVPGSNKAVSYDSTFMTGEFKLEFIRSVGVKTVIGSEFALQECPNCGAVIEMNAQGKCIYCETLLLNGEHSWVLNKIEPGAVTKIGDAQNNHV